jgi:hypothetical protein
MRSLLALFVVAGLAATPALAADPNKPHPHQGVLPTFSTTPPVPDLTADDLAKLAQGKAVQKQVQGEAGGRGIAVQDVAAPPAVVWSRITSYPRYPEWVDGVFECEVYEIADEHIKARFLIGAMGVKVEYFIDHVYDPTNGVMTWTLDYSRESDLDDSVGFWRVLPHPEKAGWSRVVYSVNVRLKGWVPGFIESMIAKKGLTQATEWVKRESEAVATASGG